MDTNYNLATTTNFKLEINDGTDFSYFIQSVDFPGMTLPEAPTPWRDHYAYMPGDTIQYDPLTIQFIVNEDYSNYMQLVSWMRLCRKSTKTIPFHDMTLYLLNNNKVGNISIVFQSAFPTMIGSISFDNSNPDNPSITCSATFRYQEFEFYNRTTELTMPV